MKKYNTAGLFALVLFLFVLSAAFILHNPDSKAGNVFYEHRYNENPEPNPNRRNDEKISGDNKAGGVAAESFLNIAFFGVIFFTIYKLMSRNSVKSSMRLCVSEFPLDDKKSVTLNAVAGNDEAKESVCDIIDFIKNPEKYGKYGARMPKGIIFYGSPGTGKTLLAKAVAGEAGVPFYAVSGSDFVQMYVGVGALRIRELFKKARAGGKAVIFIDEIDALGKKRTSSTSGGNDERDQTLNALLTEMSGFGSDDGIVVIAATNRIELLDEALLRPGRFDRQIEISLPDISGREKILSLHAKSKPLSENVDITKLAKQTVYFSGAMLENLLNEAAIISAKNESDIIDNDAVEKAYYTVIAGSEKKDRSALREKDRKITAFHEAGHALITKIAAPENTIHKITIIPSTKGAGGFCINIPPDKMFYTKKEIESQIMISYGGRAAEEIMFGKDFITTGASNDIEKATSLIKDYVTKYGMGNSVGLLNINMLSEEKKPVLDECIEIAERLYNQAKEILLSNIDKLECIANSLLEKESIYDGDKSLSF